MNLRRITKIELTSYKMRLLLKSLKGINYQVLYQLLAELIQAGGEILGSEIQKLINSVWNKKELPQQ
jgi:hypothetical protein